MGNGLSASEQNAVLVSGVAAGGSALVMCGPVWQRLQIAAGNGLSALTQQNALNLVVGFVASSSAL